MNTDHEEKTSIRENILKKIRMDALPMRPKTYFTLKVAAFVVVTLATLVVSVLLCTFIFFSVRVSGHESLLRFGPRGFLVFAQFFPWFLLTLDVVLVVLLESLLRRFRFGYKSPVIYLFIGLLVVTISGALSLEGGLGINDRLLRQADQNHLAGPLGDFYKNARHLRPEGSGVCRCTITAIQGNVLTAIDTDIGSTTVLTIVVPQDSAQATTSSLEVGDVVFVVGDEVGTSTLNAFGLRLLSPEDLDHEDFRHDE